MPRQQQLALPIGQVEVPEHLLRAVYQRSKLKQSFDDAMKVTHLRISLMHEAILLGSVGRNWKRR